MFVVSSWCCWNDEWFEPTDLERERVSVVSCDVDSPSEKFSSESFSESVRGTVSSWCTRMPATERARERSRYRFDMSVWRSWCVVGLTGYRLLGVKLEGSMSLVNGVGGLRG